MTMPINGYAGYPQGYGYQTAGRFVEVLPVDTEAEVHNFRMSAGGTAVFSARNGSFLAVKSAEINGDVHEDFYDLRPPAPPPKPFDPGEYVRKDEIAAIVAELRRREAAENEPV
jgi:hypothetical protein